ncbi:hypothetical protein F0L68_14550 [Solihabitans fulvus]|uniref:YCII-related domain-containing protein n=2 Tax=Solihabitans fulvus TaxID=1892852 RepID=A0A5B2XG19_9PSEU|nr:hypothetical protein F0L68_14550 [Solihabitans fulvus]
MKYMLLICAGGGGVEDPGDVPTIEQWLEEVGERRLHGSQMRPGDATTVRARGGEVLLTDGPFAETKEQICGYDLLECDSLEEAQGIAARHPVAFFGSVEVRPLFDDE